MSYNQKISVIILGDGKSLKEALITNMTGKDLSALHKAYTFQNTCAYETEIHKFICTADLTGSSQEIRELFSGNFHYDMCLLVVESGFQPGHVSKQIADLARMSRKTKDDFIVVLPFQQEFIDAYPFRCYTMEQLFRKLEEHRHLEQSRKRQMFPHQHTNEEDSGWQSGSQWFVDKYPERKKDQIWSHDFGGQPPRNYHSNTAGNPTGPKINLVLVGMSGTGKSASGNTILGKKHFNSVASSKPVTTECQVEETVIKGIPVRVIDTPDLYGDNMRSVRGKHVMKCKQLCESEPCVYLLVIQASRFTDGERDILRKLEKYFQPRVQERTIILFTHGEDLRRSRMSVQDFLSSCEPDLRKTVQCCGGRFVLFENSRQDAQQVETLMCAVTRMC